MLSDCLEGESGTSLVDIAVMFLYIQTMNRISYYAFLEVFKVE